MAISGFGLGGMASGITEAANNISQQMQLASVLKLQVAREQQNQKHADYMKLREQLVTHLGDTIGKLKIAHQDWTDQQVTTNPAVKGLTDMLRTYDKNLKLPETADSVTAGFVAQPSEAVTEGKLAQAKELPDERALRQSEISKNQAQTQLYKNEGGGDDNSPNAPLVHKFAVRAGTTDEEMEVAGRALYQGNTSVLQNLGRGAQGGAAVKAVKGYAFHLAMEDNGNDPDKAAAALNQNAIQFSANKTGASAGARTAATRGANLEIITDTASSAIDAAEQASAKVERGSFVPLNRVIQGGKILTSDPNMKVFAQKNLQFAELWAKSMNPTGTMRESDRQLALDVLSTATSPETYRMVAESIKDSIGLEKGAVKKFLRERGLGAALDKNPDALSDDNSSGGGISGNSGGVKWKVVQ